MERKVIFDQNEKQALKRARKKKGIRNYQIAEHLGIASSSLANKISCTGGRRFTEEEAKAVYDFLGGDSEIEFLINPDVRAICDEMLKVEVYGDLGFGPWGYKLLSRGFPDDDSLCKASKEYGHWIGYTNGGLDGRMRIDAQLEANLFRGKHYLLTYAGIDDYWALGEGRKEKMADGKKLFGIVNGIDNAEEADERIYKAIVNQINNYQERYGNFVLNDSSIQILGREPQGNHPNCGIIPELKDIGLADYKRYIKKEQEKTE